MQNETIKQIAALKIELAAIEASEAKIKAAIYGTIGGAILAVTFWFAGLF